MNKPFIFTCECSPPRDPVDEKVNGCPELICAVELIQSD